MIIDANFWHDHNVIVPKGITIGYTIIAAKNVVTYDLPGNVIAVRQPSRVAKYL